MFGRTATRLAARRSFTACGSSLIRYRDSLSVGGVAKTMALPQQLAGSDPSRRFFSSNKPQRNNRKNKNNGVIMNEDLIHVLMRRYDAAAADLMVRLVIDEGPTNPSSIDVVPLRKAMEMAFDLDVDLIGINLNQDPPVVKAQDYTKLTYKASAKKQQSKSDKKPTKEFKFRSGIADNDLDRKVNDVVKYLKKGHNCQLNVTANGFNMRTNPGGLQMLIEDIFKKVGDIGICERGVQSNEDGNRAFLVLRPNLKASKQ